MRKTPQLNFQPSPLPFPRKKSRKNMRQFAFAISKITQKTAQKCGFSWLIFIFERKRILLDFSSIFARLRSNFIRLRSIFQYRQLVLCQRLATVNNRTSNGFSFRLLFLARISLWTPRMPLFLRRFRRRVPFGKPSIVCAPRDVFFRRLGT